MKLSGWFLAAALAVPAVHAQVPPSSGDAPAARDAGAQDAAPEKKRRLKFKGAGPTCVCANPVSESDIMAAPAAGAQSPAGSGAGQQPGSTPGRSEK